MCFAFTVKGSVTSENYNLYADLRAITGDSDEIHVIDRVADSDERIPSVNALDDYDVFNGDAGDGVLPVKLRVEPIPGTPSSDDIGKYSAELTSEDQDLKGHVFVAGGFLYSDDALAPYSAWSAVPWDGWDDDAITKLAGSLQPNTKYYVVTYLTVYPGTWLVNPPEAKTYYSTVVEEFVTLPSIADATLTPDADGDVLINAVFEGGEENIGADIYWGTGAIDPSDPLSYIGSVSLSFGIDFDHEGLIDEYTITFTAAGDYNILIVLTNVTGQDTKGLTCTVLTVTFESNGGSAVSDKLVVSGGTVTEPAAPGRSTYMFGGWYTDDVTFDDAFVFGTTAVTDDITLYAKWDHDPAYWYMLTFESNGGSPVDTQYSLMTSPSASAEPPEPAKASYIFAGWYEDDVIFAMPFVFGSDINSNITLYAKWDHDPAYWYMLTFESNGGSPVDTQYSLMTSPSASAEPPEPAKASYIFAGWNEDDVIFAMPFVFGSDIDSNITLYAKWDHDPSDWAKVTFDPNNGDDEWHVWVMKGDPVARPVHDPVKPMLIFGAWYFGDTEWDFGDAVDDDMELTAGYTATVTITSDTDSSFEYTFDDWITTEGMFSITAGDHYAITVAEGTVIGIRVTSEHDGYEIQWDDGAVTQKGPVYVTAVNTDIDVTVTFTAPDDPPAPWAWLTLVLLGLLFLLIFLDDDDDEIFGKVTKNGEGVEGVKIAYTADGVRKTVTTDRDGDYSIPAAVGSVVIISEVSKNGVMLTENEIQINVQKERTRADIAVR
ncbi:MAG: InlB B-repeat-containing protein [Methanomassiliicoccaceae archaeon]|nr:InlB B-repeat-containing protein [Methanomassiliicoccaceae archaeon]